MKRLIPLISVLLLNLTILLSQETPVAFKIYNGDGEEVRWEEVIRGSSDVDVVLFGELHDNHIGHWLEYELAKTLIEKSNQWILGAEMFEFDQQNILDEYMDGYIVQSSFEEDTRLWSNYKDYKPLIELAKEYSRNFIATNIPRRYARTVYYYGLDTLNAITNQYPTFLPSFPLDIDTTLESYASLKTGMNLHSSDPKYLLEAQAIKDAVMAHNICINLNHGTRMIHFNGAYHSDSYEGINYFLNTYCTPRVITISMGTSLDCVFPEEKKNIADFIIITNQNL